MAFDFGSLFQTALGAAIGIGFMVGLAPTGVGDKLLGHFFDRKLNKIKHEQDAKIENLRVKLGVAGDRGVRANEKEFDALVKAWEQFITAFIATKVCVIGAMSYPDFKKLQESEIVSYLQSTELSEIQQKQVLGSADRGGMYSQVVRFRQIQTAGAAIFEAREIVRKQGIFLLENIEMEIENALSMCSSAQAEQLIRFHEGPGVGHEALAKIMKDGDGVSTNLKRLVRSRLMAFDTSIDS